MEHRVQNRIREIRLKRGLTLMDLARKIGCSAAYLSDIERGNRGGSYQTVERIADALGVTVDELKEGA